MEDYSHSSLVSLDAETPILFLSPGFYEYVSDQYIKTPYTSIPTNERKETLDVLSAVDVNIQYV